MRPRWGRDFFEARIDLRPFVKPANHNVNFWMNTDVRKAFLSISILAIGGGLHGSNLTIGWTSAPATAFQSLEPQL